MTHTDHIQIALVHSHYSEQHIADVIAEMRHLGPPTIKAVWMECYGHWAALEGCHRIRAAAALGLSINIEEIDYSDDHLSTIGVEGDMTISEVADSSRESVIISI